MNCLLCNSNETKEIFSYKEGSFVTESKKYFANVGIRTCENCKISYCTNIIKENLDNYYKSIYQNTQNKKKDRFKEFNSRFFSQVLFFINHVKLHKNIKVLEVGPSNLGILPSLKIFQEKIYYYYFDQITLKHKFNNITKLGDYFDPDTSKLPEIDLIWMSHSLEHIIPKDLIKIIKTYHDALKKGGKIFIEIPNDVKTKSFNVPHTLFFEKEGLSKLFEKLNFKILAISEINSVEHLNFSNLKNENKNTKIEKKSFLNKLYLFIQTFIPDKYVKKYAFKHFISNGPNSNFPIIRLIVEKKD